MDASMQYTIENVFGEERLADFQRHCRDDAAARELLAAGGKIILEAIDGSGGGVEASLLGNGELVFEAKYPAHF